MTSLVTADQRAGAPGNAVPLTLPIVAAVARVLAADLPFADRVDELFMLLRAALGYRDGRLLCWAQGAQPGVVGLLYTSREPQAAPWDEQQTRQVAERTSPLRIGQESTSAYLGLPIRWDGQLWGVVELRYGATGTGGEALLALAEKLLLAIGPLLAAAIAGSAGEQPVARSSTSTFAIAATQLVLDNHRRSLLLALGRELEAPLGLHALLAFLLRWSLDLLGSEAGAIALIEPERGELAIQVFSGYHAPTIDTDQILRVSWEQGLAGRVARSGRPALLRDVGRAHTLLAAPEAIRAELAVPIGPEGRPLAVLVLSSTRAAAFGDGDLAFVQALCERAAQPLRRALELQVVLEDRTQLGQVFASLPTGLALIDQGGLLLRCNPAWFSTWQIAPPEQGQGHRLPWDLLPLLLGRLSEPLALADFCVECQQNPDETKATFIKLVQPPQDLQVLSVPTRDSLGRLTGRLWAVSDITREREVERLKNEFVSAVSHELRTPLTSILGYTELLIAREFPADERRSFVETVYTQAQQLSQLVEDLLGVSRLDAGHVKLNRWVVGLRPIIDDLTNQLNAALSEHHRLLMHVPERLPPLYIDRDKVRQIMLNLLNNAIKYSPHGGEVVLTAEIPQRLPEDHPPGRFVLISVSDQGLGIAKEDQPRIWERFYRVDNSNTRQIGGTGLGLSITKALVELHGGRIWLRSALGRGSTFYVTLPIASEVVRPMLPAA